MLLLGNYFPVPNKIINAKNLANYVREVCGKSKWKFKMAFAMKGGGSRVPHTYFEK